VLDLAFVAVRTFHPMSQQELDPMLAKTGAAASIGRFEPVKTTSISDGAAKNPDWLGEEPPDIQQLLPAG